MKQITLTILETSDIHGNVLPINYANNEHSETGLLKIATLIKNERNKNKNTILIDNGDLIQGTPLTYHYILSQNHNINPMIKLLNELQYDAAVIGNHEFNYGLDVLNLAVKKSDFPWLSANIVLKSSGDSYFGKPYIIKEMEHGIKVAILGVTTHYIPNWENPSNIEGLRFEDALKTTKRWVTKIRNEEKPNVLIVSYHGGFECDIETGEATETLTGENQAFKICQEVEGIDVLLTGHQHRSITGEVNGVSVVQPSFNGQALGKVSITLTGDNGNWGKSHTKAELLLVHSIEADRESYRIIEDYETETQLWLDKPMGKLLGDMIIEDPLEIRLKDNALIEFINKVQMEAANAKISNTALFNNLSKGFPNNITMRDIVSTYIYPNTLKVIQITGFDIKKALERSASYFTIINGEVAVSPEFTTPKPQHYNYDIWEGIEYIFDLSKPVGNRVTKLNYNGVPVDLEAKFNVVMNNYRAGGGGDYTMFKNKPVVKDIPLDMPELIANYILHKGTIEATVNNNWKVIW